MNHLRLPLGVLLLAFCANGALAERTPARTLPLTDDGNARVIVKFKPGAALLRAHALSATAGKAAAATALDERAAVIGARAWACA